MVPSVLGCATKVDAVKPTIRIRREFHAHELVREPAVRVHPTHTIRRVEVKWRQRRGRKRRCTRRLGQSGLKSGSGQHRLQLAIVVCNAREELG